MTAGSPIAPRPQAAAPSPKDAYPGQPAPSAGSPQRRRPLPSLTLRNKISALTLLALTFIPAHHASAQIYDISAPDSLTIAIVEDQNFVSRVLQLGAPGAVIAIGTFTEQDTTGQYGRFQTIHITPANPESVTMAYTLDNSNPAVDGLHTGETLQETFTVEAVQGAGDTPVSAIITIEIRGVGADSIPTFAATITPQIYPISAAVNVTLPAATGDGTLTYAITETLPTGLAFDGTTRVLSGTTTATEQAVMTYTYTATDGDTVNPDSVEQTFTIAVIDSIPTFGTTTIAPQTYPINNAVNVTLPAATGGNTPVTYAITGTLPAGLAFNGTTRVLDGIPTTEQNADAVAYTYTATDGDPTDPDTTPPLPFTIAIADLIPVIVFADGSSITVDEGAEVTLDATGSSDPEGQGLMYQWAQVQIPDDAMPVTFNPANGQAQTVTFMAPEERTRLTFTLTLTDGTGKTDTDTLTVSVGRSSERALQKTLAAFGRAFATGTVGVFEDYLSGTGGRTNTSHFTLGGHKFELADNTPAQTLDSRVASVRKPLTRQRTLTLENDHSVVNTPSVSYPQKYKSPSVSFPNDRKTGSDSDHVFHRIGNPVEHDPAQPANLADTTTTMSARDLLMKSAFHFNLNDDATATSGWSLWARATTSNFNGKPEDDFDLDGDVTSAYLGMDYQTPTGTRLGLAISETSGDVDYDDATDEAQGDLDADLTSILPYIQWQPNDTTTAWAMLGYGEGDAELSTDGEAETTEVDIDMQMIALGLSGDLTTYKRSEWSWKASAFAVELESEADEATDLPAVTADSQRLRAAIQGRVPGQASATGTQFTPNWELGLRWDDGDAEQGGGADLGLGFNYTNPVNGLSVQGKTTFLVAHEAEDYEEWEASLQARLDSGVQGRGVTFTLEPAWTADGRSQKMGMDFSNALGKWTKRGLRLELTGERTERDDNDIGHNIRLTGSLRF